MIWMNGIMEGCKIFAAYVFPLFLAGTVLTVFATRSVNVAKSVAFGAFLLYGCCVFGLVFLPLPGMEEAAALTYRAELMPFHCIGDALKDPFRGTLVILFNVIMTIPFGMFLRYYFGMDAKRVFLYSLALTTVIEFGQFSGLFFIFKGSYRLFEVDDLILNTLGGMLGYLAVKKTEGLLPVLSSFDKSLGRGKLKVVRQNA